MSERHAGHADLIAVYSASARETLAEFLRQARADGCESWQAIGFAVAGGSGKRLLKVWANAQAIVVEEAVAGAVLRTTLATPRGECAGAWTDFHRLMADLIIRQRRAAKCAAQNM